MKSPFPLLGRFGLLASTVAMGIALMATGVAGYAAAREAAEALVQARSIDVAFAVRRELHLAAASDRAHLDSILAEFAQQEVRYLAVADAQGAILASSGTPSTVAGRHDASPQTAGANVEWSWVADRIRVVAPMGRPWRAREQGGGNRTNPWGGHEFIVEFLPGPARALTSRALATLILSCAAAALLLSAALISWRRTREAEVLSAQLARDQQLKSLGQMSAVLSHELRNPLTTLKGHAQLLLEKLDSDHPCRAGAERVVAGALRLEAIANRILDFSKPGAVVPRPENPRTVAEAAIELVGDPRARLSVAPGVESWPLDRLRMEQLLVNLIRNASEASPDGGAIEVDVGRENGLLVFAVRDHGSGLPPGEEARIFEPFFGRRVRGTGLGLAICKQIAEAHGGRIEGLTHPEGGAFFRVLLPGPEARP